MAAEHLLNEVESAKLVFESRKRLPGAEAGHASLAASFTTSLVAQINAGCGYTAEEATKIQAALEESPYGAAGVKLILCALDAKMN